MHCEQRKVEGGEQHLPFGEAKCVYFPTRTTAKLTQPCKLRTRTREKAAEKKRECIIFRQRMNDYWQVRCFIERQV